MTPKKEIELLKQEIKVLEAKLSLLEEIEKHNAKPKMTLEISGKFEIVSYNGEVYYRLEYPTNVVWCKQRYKCASDEMMLVAIIDLETHRLLEGVWFNDVKKGKYDEPYCPDDPEWYDEVEWDEKDNPNLQKIIDKMVEERKAQKLWNRLHDELGYSVDLCDEIVDLVEDWILDEQSSAGSQNVNTELLVEGFNDCVRQMKEMLS
jgi:hypothetical protein